NPACVLAKLTAATPPPAGSTNATVSDCLWASTPPIHCCVTLETSGTPYHLMIGTPDGGVGPALLGSAWAGSFQATAGPATPRRARQVYASAPEGPAVSRAMARRGAAR